MTKVHETPTTVKYQISDVSHWFRFHTLTKINSMQNPHRKSSEFLWRCGKRKNVWTGDIDNLSKLRVNQTLTDLPTRQMDKPHENAAGKDGSLQNGALLRKQETTAKSDQTL